VNWEAIGAIAELIAAIAVLPTLLYVAVQVRQNTRALKSSTFQELSSSLSSNAEAIVSIPSMVPLLVKLDAQHEPLTAEEKARFHYFMIMVFRRLEAVHIQRSLGSIDPEVIEGFQHSTVSLLVGGAGAAWWATGKRAFSKEFVDWLDAQLASGTSRPFHPGFGQPPAAQQGDEDGR
jgi:hypothetical protein